MRLLGLIVDLYSMVVLASVLVSWIRVSPDHPAVRAIESLTRPALEPIRRVLPPFGGLDFSPMVLLLGLQLLRGLL